MHILVTDILTCPRCGPAFGLILLADRLEDRRVLDGRLGCANCRQEYPVTGGFADLRYPPGAPPAGEPEEGPAVDDALRLAAMMGVSAGPGRYLVAGSAARLAPAIAALAPDAEIIAVHAGLSEMPERPGVSRLAAGASLPLASGTVRAAALANGEEWVAEALRVLAAGGRLVLDPAPAGTADRLRSAGLQILLDEEGVVVASPPLAR